MRDTITLGAIAGTISTIVFFIVDWLIISWLGTDYTSAWEAGANIYLNDDLIHTPAGFILGITNSFLLGGSIGVLIAITLRLSGKDYYLIKGIGISLMWRMGTFGILAPIANIAPQIKGEIHSQMIALINFLIIGIVSSAIIAKYISKVKHR